FNNMVNFLQQNSAYIDQNVLNEIINPVNAQAANLQSIGITINNDNTLSVNQGQLIGILNNNQNQAQGIISGLATNIISVVQQIQSSSATNYINTQTNSFLNNLNSNIKQYSYGLYNYLALIENNILISNLLPSGSLVNTIL
ncbi:MAG: hypothetical protein ACPL2F_07015, partial [Dissulfurimicrobium hydrothermale]